MIKAPTNKRTSHGRVILRRNSETTTPRSISKNGTKPTRIDFVAGDQDRETVMGLAQYQILPQGDEWGVLHDGDIRNRYAIKEAAFEAAVAAASLAIREGHEVHISVHDRSSGNQTALGAKDQDY
jgi:hypothetical protein